MGLWNLTPPREYARVIDHETTDSRLWKLHEVVRNDKKYGRANGFRYHDDKPGIIEGLLSRGWTPCYDCGVCPEMGTDIQIGPTGQRLFPLSVV